jgi:nitrile hydratase
MAERAPVAEPPQRGAGIAVNGPHDLGGLPGLGPIPDKELESPFREDWERQAFAMSVAGVVGGSFGVDDHKTAVEGLHPIAYMSMHYWEQWLYATEVCFTNAGAFSRADVDRRVAELAEDPAAPQPPGANRELEESLERFISRGVPQISLERERRFAAGEVVRVRSLRVEPGRTHTSLPAYVQGRLGTVELCHRPEPLGDAIVAGEGVVPEFVYTVRFGCAELWPDGDPRSDVRVDLFESYLEPAENAEESDV